MGVTPCYLPKLDSSVTASLASTFDAELKVEPSNKTWVHSILVGSVFFLVWLVRIHAVYPEK